MPRISIVTFLRFMVFQGRQIIIDLGWSIGYQESMVMVNLTHLWKKQEISNIDAECRLSRSHLWEIRRERKKKEVFWKKPTAFANAKRLLGRQKK